jgi:hypothetical protein
MSAIFKFVLTKLQNWISAFHRLEYGCQRGTFKNSSNYIKFELAVPAIFNMANSALVLN